MRFYNSVSGLLCSSSAICWPQVQTTAPSKFQMHVIWQIFVTQYSSHTIHHTILVTNYSSQVCFVTHCHIIPSRHILFVTRYFFKQYSSQVSFVTSVVIQYPVMIKSSHTFRHKILVTNYSSCNTRHTLFVTKYSSQTIYHALLVTNYSSRNTRHTLCHKTIRHTILFKIYS